MSTGNDYVVSFSSSHVVTLWWKDQCQGAENISTVIKTPQDIVKKYLLPATCEILW